MSTILWILIIIVVVLLGGGLVLSFYYTRHRKLGEIHSPSEYGLQFEAVEFNATDGVILRGVWIPDSGSDKAVIIMHGLDGSYDSNLFRVPPLHKTGFNVLLFDFRAHGRSEGKKMTLGYEERRDVNGAIEFLHKMGMKHIGLLGISYGGMVSILSAADNPAVEAVIVDGPAASWNVGVKAFGRERGVPTWLIGLLAWLFFNITSLRLRTNLYQYEPIHWVGKISPRPIFFIHGNNDGYLANFDELYAAAKPPKEFWRLTDAGHTTASQLYPEEYNRRVVDFFTRYL